MNLYPVKFAIPQFFVWIVAGACLLPVLLRVAGINFGHFPVEDRQIWHTVFEIAGISIALVTVVLSVVDFRIKGDVSTPIVGLALLCSAIFDVVHLLASNGIILKDHGLTFVNLYTWNFSRTFNATILLVGGAMFLRHSDNLFRNVHRHKKKFLILCTISFLLITGGLISLLFSDDSLSRFESNYQVELIMGKLDIIPLMIYLFLLTIIFPKFYSNHPSIFSQTLLVSLIPAIAAQLHMVFGEHASGNHHYFIAHYDKIISYFVPFIGISLNYLHTYDSEKRVIQAYRNESEEKQAARNVLKGVLDASPAGVLMLKPVRNPGGGISDFVCTLSNPSADRIFGGEISGRHLSEFLPGKETFASLHSVSEGNEQPGIDVQGSNDRWLALSAVKLDEGIILNITEITERKKYELRLIENETYNRKVTDLTPNLVFVFDIRRMVPLFINRRVAEILGYSAEEWLSFRKDDISDILSPAAIAGITALAGQLEGADEKSIFELESEIRKKTGEWRTFDTRISVFRKNEASVVTEIIGIAQDVTEQKKAAEAIERNSILYKALASNMPDTEILLYDVNMVIILADGCMKPLLLKDRASLIGQTISDFLTRYDLAELTDFLNSPEEGELNPVEKIIGDRHFKFQLHPVRKSSGETFAGMLLIHDITELKHTQTLLERKIQDLNRSNVELEQFAYVASHDLQEPLRKITAFADRLRLKHAERLSEEGKVYISRMFDASMRMQVLINELLTFSRVSRMNEQFVRTDLNAILRNVISDFDEKVAATGTTISVGEFPVVEAIPSQMERLFQNLVSNSIKFRNRDAGTVINITGEIISAREAGFPDSVPAKKFVRITVKDNGIGFEQQFADRIFIIFQRLHGRSEYEGTGIGLAICKKIAENHGGSISATSVPGEGSTFTVVLPVKQGIV